MTRRVPPSLLALLPLVAAELACGPGFGEPEPPPPIFGERCGVTAPHLQLSLARDEFIPSDPAAIATRNDLWFIAINTQSSPVEGSPDPAAVVDRRLVVTNPCGGGPTAIMDGVDRVFAPPSSNLPWVGCASDTGATILFLPDANPEPTELGLPFEGCHFERGSSMIAMQSGSSLTMVTPSPLGTYAIGNTSGLSTEPRSLAVGDDTLWFVTEEGRLIEMPALTPAAAFVLAEDVGGVVIAQDRRFLAWSTESDPDALGPWTVHDRDTGMSLPVEVAGRTQVRLVHAGLSFVFESPAPDGTVDDLQVRLPSLDPVAFTGSWAEVFDTTPDDLGLVAPEPEGGVYRLVPEADPTLLYEGVPLAVRGGAGQAWIWEPDPEAASPETIRLVRVPLDGGDPEILVEGIADPVSFDDDRWLAVNDEGVLEVIDPAQGTATQVDRGVSPDFARLNAPQYPVPGAGRLSAGATLVYPVHDGTHRHGLWSATLAPTR